MPNYFSISLGLSLLMAVGTLSQTNGFCNLVWNDEFDGNTIDTNKWSHEVNCWGGGNNELQCYTARPQNSFVQNGNLVLRVIPERYTGTQEDCTHNEGCTNTRDFTSARLRTRNAPGGSWLRGRFEIRAKLPKGSHIWPAIWMLPTDNVYGAWANSGEIDIMEYRGQFSDRVEGTLHYGGYWPNNRHRGSSPRTFPFEFSSDFHVFSVEWEENEMRWFVDDNNFHTQNLNRNWYEGNNPAENPYTANGQPWDQRFHMLLNVAVGGGFFNGLPPLTDADVAAWTSSEMIIDYVRVYSKGGDCSSGSITPPSSSPSPSPSSNDSIPIDPSPSLTTPVTGSANAEEEAEEGNGKRELDIKSPVVYVPLATVLLLIVLGTIVGFVLLRRYRQRVREPIGLEAPPS